MNSGKYLKSIYNPHNYYNNTTFFIDKNKEILDLDNTNLDDNKNIADKLNIMISYAKSYSDDDMTMIIINTI